MRMRGSRGEVMSELLTQRARGKWRGKPKDMIVDDKATSRRFRQPLSKSEVEDERGIHESGAERWALRNSDGA